MIIGAPFLTGANQVAKKAKETKGSKRREWTKADVRELKQHSRSKTPVVKIAKLTKRTNGALRQKAFELGLSLGHQR
jgi:hypothetical protein